MHDKNHTILGGFTMGITLYEFQTAMETYGAERIKDGSSQFANCFKVADISFYHSDSKYIVQGKMNEKFVNRAMSELGDDSWHEEINTVRGILTLAAIIEEKYAKELIEELLNNTYKRMLVHYLIRRNVDFEIYSEKMRKLYKYVFEYCNMVNPFGNCEIDFKEPIQYLDTVNVNIGLKEGKNYYRRLKLSSKLCQAVSENNKKQWFYKSFIQIPKDKPNGYIKIRYYCPKVGSEYFFDNVVHLCYKSSTDSFNKRYPEDIDLRIGFKTETAWEPYKERYGKNVTDEQIDIMIKYLKITIDRLKEDIVCHMIDGDATCFPEN